MGHYNRDAAIPLRVLFFLGKTSPIKRPAVTCYPASPFPCRLPDLPRALPMLFVLNVSRETTLSSQQKIFKSCLDEITQSNAYADFTICFIILGLFIGPIVHL